MKKIFIIIFISLSCFGDRAGIGHNNNRVDLKKLTIKNGKLVLQKKKRKKKNNTIYLDNGVYIYGYYYNEYGIGYYCYGSLCEQL